MAGENTSIGLNASNFAGLLGGGTSTTSATNSYPYAAGNTGNSKQSIWQQLIGSTPDIIASSASLITALKVDRNNINYSFGGNNNAANQNGGNQPQNNNNMWLRLGIGLLLLVGIVYWATRK